MEIQTCSTGLALGRRVLGDGEAKDAAAVLKALAEPTRLRLVSLVRAAEDAVCVCDFTDVVDLSQPTVSHHLKILVDAGILTRERRGTWSYYSLVPGALERAQESLASL